MCPNLNLLRSYKVYPRKLDFDYIKDRFFIYVYLNPFEELNQPLVVKLHGKEYCFAYVPFYVGKGTGAGYRHNQHISSFIKEAANNPIKVQIFKHIQDEMSVAAAKNDKSKPWNWDEFQKQYVIILETFNNAKESAVFEIELIRQLGTIYDKTGPLANKIRNITRYDFLMQTGNGQVL